MKSTNEVCLVYVIVLIYININVKLGTSLAIIPREDEINDLSKSNNKPDVVDVKYAMERNNKSILRLLIRIHILILFLKR